MEWTICWKPEFSYLNTLSISGILFLSKRPIYNNRVNITSFCFITDKCLDFYSHSCKRCALWYSNHFYFKSRFISISIYSFLGSELDKKVNIYPLKVKILNMSVNQPVTKNVLKNNLVGTSETIRPLSLSLNRQFSD